MKHIIYKFNLIKYIKTCILKETVHSGTTCYAELQYKVKCVRIQRSFDVSNGVSYSLSNHMCLHLLFVSSCSFVLCFVLNFSIMGNKENFNKKKSRTAKRNNPKKTGKRITRSASKIQENSIVTKKLETEQSEKLNARITRSALKLSEIRIVAKDLKKVEHSDKSANPPRITRSRSSNKTSHIDVQQIKAPFVEPTKQGEKKAVVKRADFIKLNTFEKSCIVLAKQKYSCPWPARILDIEKNKVLVYFFGDRRTGFVSASEIYDFVKSYNAIKSVILSKAKPRAYLTGIREVEHVLGMNNTVSLFNIV